MSGISNPYGKSKYIVEEILKDVCKSHHIKCIILRYFNPLGYILITCHPLKYHENLMDVILDSIISNKKFIRDFNL
jgi:UDP-glucose 4-epimerase